MTPAEHRLRERAAQEAATLDPHAGDLTLAADALALLAELEPACANAAAWTAWKRRVSALLTRATEP